tara:strand:+ start:1461 stop:1718 length:258 start_codon:yes stop_codon:yes gene_type:complete
MPEVRMTLEEYEELVRGAMTAPNRKQPAPTGKMTMKVKRKGTPDPKMAKALKKANAMGRTKSGKLRKGYDQARIMKTAHKLRRKM